MRTSLVLAMAVALTAAAPAWAQRPGETGRPEEPPRGEVQRGEPQRGEVQRGETQRPVEPAHTPPRANQGRIPQPPAARDTRARPEPDRRNGRVNETPHVANDHWYGHDRPNDARYRQDRPFAHGRFEHFGPSYRYNIVRFDPDLHRFWLPGGYFFEVASWDWPIAMDWCWNCGGDDFVIYEDLDHPGWYLLYNVHTGGYIHVSYLGT